MIPILSLIDKLLEKDSRLVEKDFIMIIYGVVINKSNKIFNVIVL